MVEHAQVLGSNADNSDLDLLRGVAGGDEGALRAMYVRHGPRILSYLIGRLGDRHVAEEVLQDVMMAVWNGAASFRGESKVQTWLLAIARHLAINSQRGSRLECAIFDEAIPADNPEPFEALVLRSDLAEVCSALKRLPADQRETLELLFYHGLTGPEAAALMRVARGTVKSRLHRARAALRRLLRSKEDANA